MRGFTTASTRFALGLLGVSIWLAAQETCDAAAALGGYDLKDCGQILWEQ